MSKATKRKHVTKEILEDYYVPEDGEEIVKLIGGRGNNLHEVISTNGKKYLVSMPTKFRKNVWVKRGDYVIVSSISEGVKVQGEIVYILFDKQIKYLKDENLWPEEFTERKEEEKNVETENERCFPNSEESDEDDDNGLFENPNHRHVIYHDDDSSDESSDENESESDDENNILQDNVLSEKLDQLKT